MCVGTVPNNPSHACSGRVTCPLLVVIDNPAIKNEINLSLKQEI